MLITLSRLELSEGLSSLKLVELERSIKAGLTSRAATVQGAPRNRSSTVFGTNFNEGPYCD